MVRRGGSYVRGARVRCCVTWVEQNEETFTPRDLGANVSHLASSQHRATRTGEIFWGSRTAITARGGTHTPHHKGRETVSLRVKARGHGLLIRTMRNAFSGFYVSGSSSDIFASAAVRRARGYVVLRLRGGGFRCGRFPTSCAEKTRAWSGASRSTGPDKRVRWKLERWNRGCR